ncbi:MAG: hypothetical protein ACT4PZ_08790 [Panacagrimonas sp.]
MGEFAADVAVELEIEVGQTVAFSGVGGVAFKLAGIDGGAMQDLRGTLIDFDSRELIGWIDGDDGGLYRFSSAEVVGEEEIAIGERVAFSGMGELACRVRRAELPALASVPVPVPAPVAHEPSAELRAPRAVVSVESEHGETAAPRKNRLLAAFMLAVVLTGGLAYIYVQRDAAPAPAAKAPVAAPAPAAEAPPSELAAAPVADVAAPETVEGAAVTDEITEPASAPDIAVPETVEVAGAAEETMEVAPEPAAEVVVAAAPIETPAGETESGVGQTKSAAVAPPAEPAPAAPARVESNEAVRAEPAAATPSKLSTPASWWPAPRPGRLNLVYAGNLAGASSIVLMFDSGFAAADGADRHVQVTRSNGMPVVARWAVGKNRRMLLLPVSPGLYSVTVGPEMADAGGKTLGLPLSGKVLVR